MTFFLAWDALWLGVTAGWMAPWYVLGLAAWSLTEYIFHRCVYHLEWGILSHGHERAPQESEGLRGHALVRDADPVHPAAAPGRQLLRRAWILDRFGPGWFGGFIAYSFLHHSLHHYNLRLGWDPASPVVRTPDPSCLSGVELRRHDAILGSRLPDRVHQGRFSGSTSTMERERGVSSPRKNLSAFSWFGGNSRRTFLASSLRDCILTMLPWTSHYRHGTAFALSPLHR